MLTASAVCNSSRYLTSRIRAALAVFPHIGRIERRVSQRNQQLKRLGRAQHERSHRLKQNPGSEQYQEISRLGRQLITRFSSLNFNLHALQVPDLARVEEGKAYACWRVPPAIDANEDMVTVAQTGVKRP